MNAAVLLARLESTYFSVYYVFMTGIRTIHICVYFFSDNLASSIILVKEGTTRRRLLTGECSSPDTLEP